MKIVLLSGGSGQRLWPLSNDNYSKQYIKFMNHDEDVSDSNLIGRRDEKCSMLQRVYEQLSEAGFKDDVIVAASEAQRETVMAQLGNKVVFSSEPMRRDTFPAVLLASSFVVSNFDVEMDEVVIFIPIDPYVKLDYFNKIIDLGEMVKNGNNLIGIMGANPTYPSEKYGYIVMSEKNNGEVAGFFEKPDKATAAELIKNKALWNCGVFGFKLSTAAKWAERYNLKFDYNVISDIESYLKLPKTSFDYEVLEKADRIIAVTYNGMWKDIGTWNTFAEEMTEKIIGNVVVDDSTKDCNVINTLKTPVVVMGGNNLVITASRDGILVADKEQSSYLKNCISNMDSIPMYEERKWGTIKTIEITSEDGVGIRTNMVRVEGGQFTTYHKHLLHDEIITVVSGNGEILINDKVLELKKGVSITVERGTEHSIKAKTKLKYIEILIGEVYNDDIVRIRP